MGGFARNSFEGDLCVESCATCLWELRIMDEKQKQALGAVKPAVPGSPDLTF